MIPMPHVVTIERATDGTEDDRGVPAQTWTALAEVRAWGQPKSALEMAQLSQAGPVASDWTFYFYPTDLEEADRLRLVPDDGRIWQVVGVRNAAGVSHHYEVDCKLVEVPA